MPVALYRPRRPRASPLWQCLSEHREAFEEKYPLRFQKQDGPLRAVVAQTLDAFTACGDLTRGFARLHCDHCGHDYLIAFSCKQRYFCPCCHQKKVQQFGEFVRHEVVRKVPHRQIVVTLPKRLRKAFQRDRQLLSDFCHAAWLSLRDVIRTRLGTPNGQPGVIIAIQTFGDYLNFHPHLHILITDGAFVGSRSFHTIPRTDWQRVAELRKRCGTQSAPEAADSLPPIGRCYADFAKNREAMADQSRATAFDQGMPSNPRPDSYAPATVSQSGDSIEIIELPRNAIPRFPRKQWRKLIQKVWEVDPFICPNCARPMHINGLLEDRNAASALLQTLG